MAKTIPTGRLRLLAAPVIADGVGVLLLGGAGLVEEPLELVTPSELDGGGGVAVVVG